MSASANNDVEGSAGTVPGPDAVPDRAMAPGIDNPEAIPPNTGNRAVIDGEEPF